jgi:hypothetical protein
LPNLKKSGSLVEKTKQMVVQRNYMITTNTAKGEENGEGGS